MSVLAATDGAGVHSSSSHFSPRASPPLLRKGIPGEKKPLKEKLLTYYEQIFQVRGVACMEARETLHVLKLTRPCSVKVLPCHTALCPAALRRTMLLIRLWPRSHSIPTSSLWLLLVLVCNYGGGRSGRSGRVRWHQLHDRHTRGGARP